MSIKRTPRPNSNFTVLTNNVLRDSRLSFRARGILVSILSRPDNWQTSAESLAAESTEGRSAILTALKELEQNGYLLRTRRQNELGQWITESVIFDKPQKPKAGFPTSDEPTSGEPTSENRTPKEELLKKNYKEELFNAKAIVERYVDVYQSLYVERPPARNIGRLAKDARQMLENNHDPDLLLDAANHCATNGHANLSSAYTYILRSTTKPTVTNSWLQLLQEEQ